MFAEDIELLPGKIFTRLIEECIESPSTGYDKVPETYDLIGGLFQQMNLPGKTPAGKYKDVDYFNGGLFQKNLPVELTKKEVEHLEVASFKNWRHINPAIFGSIFESLMDAEKRHKTGAHYTHEVDIKKIVDPVIVQPWRRKIDAVMNAFSSKNKYKTFNALLQMHTELTQYKVLDPACGSGNFLFIAYKEMKLLEKEIFKHLKTLATQHGDNEKIIQHKLNNGMVTTKQFYGIDKNPTAVELAKVTLMIAKELSIKEAFENEESLPLDNLDNNIICDDALFTAWPQVDAIIGNPPFQARSKMLSEFGGEYMNKLWSAYPEMNKYADFCTYWFYKAHKHLKENCYAGLVGTDTIRQNNSRENSLDFITQNGGMIYNAYSSIDWSGEAAVYVSIVCWQKGVYDGPKELYIEEKKEISRHVFDSINSSLSISIDVTSANKIINNTQPKKVTKGQKHGHSGFLLLTKEAKVLLKNNEDVLYPYLTGDEMISNFISQPSRFVIDFTGKNIIEASAHKELFKIVEKKVLPKRKEEAEREAEQNRDLLSKNPSARVAKSYQQYYSFWWQLIGKREDMLEYFKKVNRYIVCSEVSLRPIFEFLSTEIRPNATLNVFMFNDNYSFGIIQSNIHWIWCINKCSTLGGTYRYTFDSVWDTFPWPQSPTESQIKKVAEAAKILREERTKTMQQNKMSLRDLYRLLEQPGKNPIKDLHTVLDKAVLEAYGFTTKDKSITTDFILENLLALNHEVAAKEKRGEKVQPPGLPEWIKNKEDYVSENCVRFEWK